MDIGVSILDNDLAFLTLTKLALEEDFKIEATHDNNEFIERAKEPSVLVVDWFLDEGVRGIDVMRTIKKDRPLTQFIFVSSLASVGVLLEVVNEGWGAFFIEKDKTNFHDELVEKIRRSKSLLKTIIEAAKKKSIKEELIAKRIDETLKHFK